MCGARHKFFCAVITSHSPDKVSKQEICRTHRTRLQLHAHTHRAGGQGARTRVQLGRVGLGQLSAGGRGWQLPQGKQRLSEGYRLRTLQPSLPLPLALLSDPPSGQRSRHPTASWSAKIQIQTPSCQRGKGILSPRAGRREGEAGLLRLVPRASSVSGEKGDGGVQGWPCSHSALEMVPKLTEQCQVPTPCQKQTRRPLCKHPPQSKGRMVGECWDLPPPPVLYF